MRLDEESFAGEVTAAVAVPGGTVEITAGDAVDLEAQERELAERRKRLEGEIARAEGKLANEGFTSKAPPELVDAEREKLERLRDELAAL